MNSKTKVYIISTAVISLVGVGVLVSQKSSSTSMAVTFQPSMSKNIKDKTVVQTSSSGDEDDRISSGSSSPQLSGDDSLQTIKTYQDEGDRFISEGRPQDAIQIYMDALNRFPNDPKLRVSLGLAYIEGGQLEQAKQVLEQRLAEDPADSEANFGLGSLERLNGQHDQAIARFNESLRTDPDNDDAKFNAAEILTFEKGGSGTLAEKYLAERYYNELLQKMPGNVDVQNGLAAAYLASHRAPEAIGIWENLSNQKPNEPILLSNLSEAYLAAGRTDEAIASSQKAIELDPRNSDALFLLGNAEIAKGNVSDGREAIRKALELDPDNKDYQIKFNETEGR